MKLHVNISGFCEGKVISQRETSGKLNHNFAILTDFPLTLSVGYKIKLKKQKLTLYKSQM